MKSGAQDSRVADESTVRAGSARRLLLIVNPAAAGARGQGERLEALEAGFRAAGGTVEIRVTRAPGEAIRLAQAAVGFEVVVAVGGDGTVNEVASGLLALGSAAPVLGIAAFGTGNDVAQLLGVVDDAQLLAAFRQGRRRAIDVIEAEFQGPQGPAQRAALLFAAVGFSSDIVRHTTARVKRWFGPKYSYSIGFFRALIRYRAPRIRVRAPGLDLQEPTLVVLAANAPHAGGGMMQVAPGARLDDGQMHVSVIRAATRWEAACQFPPLLKGTHVRHPKVRFFQQNELSIDAEPPLEFGVDGDLVGHTPVRLMLRPSALRVLGGPA